MKQLEEMPFEEWEPAICAAIDRRLDEGFQLISGEFGNVYQKRCCALTAYDSDILMQVFGNKLWAFIRGFDHFFNPLETKSKYLDDENLSKYYLLGAAIAEKYQDKITK